MCLAIEAIDADKLNLRMSVTTETEVHDPIGGRYPKTMGKYSSLFDLRRALESKINLGYERKDLNAANGKRLAEGDYSIPYRSLDFDTPSATQSAFAQSIIPWTIKKPGG
jgi:hypothetical protein